MFYSVIFLINYIFSVKLKIFNISIDPSSLNSFLSLFLHLIQAIERKMFFLRGVLF